MAHGDARDGKWRGYWRMEWAASTLHTTSEHGVSSITTTDTHTSAASSRMNWRPRRFKWTLRFAERRNLDSARVPSHFNWPLRPCGLCCILWLGDVAVDSRGYNGNCPYWCLSKLPCQKLHSVLLCTPIVPYTGICWPEDGPERTETCSHTKMLMIVYVVVFWRNKQFYFEY